jgi:hypothetical protein
MFNWLSSKPVYNRPASTPVTDKKAEAKTASPSFFGYLPGKNWFITQMKSFYKTLPAIGLSGTGFTVNGFAFDLANIPRNLRNSFRLFLSLCLIVKTKAEDFYFMDPTGNSTYKLSIEGTVDCFGNAQQIANSCNATNRLPPYPSDLDLLYFNECAYFERGIIIPHLRFYQRLHFYRAINEMIHPEFESCITRPTSLSSETKQILAIVGGTLGGVAMIAFAIYCYRDCKIRKQRQQYGGISMKDEAGLEDIEQQPFVRAASPPPRYT